MKKRMICLMALVLLLCGTWAAAQEGMNMDVSADTPIAAVINDPAFDGFGRLIFPTQFGEIPESLTLRNVGRLLPYHSHIEPETTLGVLRALKERATAGETVFYPIYTEAEMQENPELRDTGLFFFRGEPGAPFAIVNAGGGFAYVGAIHESLPHALALSARGYNGFALIYRAGGADVACADLARAISFIFAHADELGVSTECYSLWGGSAGARMAAYLGSYGPVAFGGDDLPRPGAVVMQYTGHSDYTPNDPPTYVCVGENDGIASWRTMQRRVEALSALGIDTEFHLYENLGHGFGMGEGTSAEGWLDDAVAFWERQMGKE